jgi:hypothetical protein
MIRKQVKTLIRAVFFEIARQFKSRKLFLIATFPGTLKTAKIASPVLNHEQEEKDLNCQTQQQALFFMFSLHGDSCANSDD